MQTDQYYLHPDKKQTGPQYAPVQVQPQVQTPMYQEQQESQNDGIFTSIKQWVSKYKSLVICVIVLLLLIIIAWIINWYSTPKLDISSIPEPKDNIVQQPIPIPNEQPQAQPQPQVPTPVPEQPQSQSHEQPQAQSPPAPEPIHDKIILTTDDEEFDKYMNPTDSPIIEISDDSFELNVSQSVQNMQLDIDDVDTIELDEVDYEINTDDMNIIGDTDEMTIHL